MRGLTRRFGGLTAVDDVDLDLAKGELVSIIGPNGAGKTTLFNLVTGLDRPDAGEVRLDGEPVTGFSPEKLAGHGIARTFQLGRVFGNLSVMDNVLIGAHTRLRAVQPATPLIGPLLELGLALLRPAAVRAEEERLREEVRGSWRGLASVCCRASISRPIACHTPIAAASRSPARWRSSRVCCCSTSRRPA